MFLGNLPKALFWHCFLLSQFEHFLYIEWGRDPNPSVSIFLLHFLISILCLTNSLNPFMPQNNFFQEILSGFQIEILRIVLCILFRHMIDYITNVFSICSPTVRVMFLKIMQQKNLWLRKRCYGKIEIGGQVPSKYVKAFWNGFSIYQIKTSKFLLKMLWAQCKSLPFTILQAW